jgi:hypothetical protein
MHWREVKSFFAIFGELLDDLRSDDLLDALALLLLLVVPVGLRHILREAPWTPHPLEHIGDLEALPGLGGDPYLGLPLEECAHLASPL